MAQAPSSHRSGCWTPSPSSSSSCLPGCCSLALCLGTASQSPSPAPQSLGLRLAPACVQWLSIPLQFREVSQLCRKLTRLAPQILFLCPPVSTSPS